LAGTWGAWFYNLGVSAYDVTAGGVIAVAGKIEVISPFVVMLLSVLN
jgi:hypothetical protein